MISWIKQCVVMISLGRNTRIIQRWKHSAKPQMSDKRLRNTLQQIGNKDLITVFERQGSRTQFKWGPWVVGGQMLMWINFADFYWRYSMEKDKETGEMKLLPAWKRGCISAIALVAGLAIGGGILHYISRSVARMQIVNGKTVRLDVFRISGKGTKAVEYPLSSVYSRDTLYTGIGSAGVTRSSGSTQYSIYAPGNVYAYLMSRSGTFQNPKILDSLFHRPKI